MAHAFERGGIPPPPLLPPPPRFAKPFERTPLVPWEQFSTLTKLASEEKRVLEEEGGGGGIGKKVSGNAHAIYIHYVPFPYRRTYLSSCVYMACVYSLRPQPSALLALSHVYVHRMMGWDGPSPPLFPFIATVCCSQPSLHPFRRNCSQSAPAKGR